MEVEGAFSSCFPNCVDESTGEHALSAKKPLPCAAGEDAGAADSCFDCNICLDSATDPVVTLCGHLYCWPCIYHWSHLEDTPNCSSLCPVCKSPFSESSLVPLYGRGLDAKPHRRSHGIPDRPKCHRKFVSPTTSNITINRQHQTYPFYGYGRSRSIGVLLALPILPWMPRIEHDSLSSSYLSSEAAGGTRGSMMQRRGEELREESRLHQLWVFLFCCAFLCLALF